MPEKENKKGKGILIGLIALFLILNGVQFFLNYQKDKTQEAQITEQASQIEVMSSEAKEQLAKLESLESELKIAKDQAEQLGLNVEDLEAEIEAINQTKNYYLKNFMKPSVRREMNAKISNYEAMLNQQNEEIRKLKANNDSLFKETIVLKDTINTLGDSISLINQEVTTQAEELRKGRVLKANSFKITAIKNPEKDKTKYSSDHEYKSKDFVQTKLDFNIESNPIALIEEKEIFVQLISPDNEVIHNIEQGGGTFTVSEKKKLYTVKQNIMYDRSTKELSLIIDKIVDYESGTYKINVWCEGEIIGKSSFTIK